MRLALPRVREARFDRGLSGRDPVSRCDLERNRPIAKVASSGTSRSETQFRGLSPNSRFAPPVGNRTAVPEWLREDETAALCVKTGETHVSAVLRKLQLSNRNELTRWAAERRLI